MKKQSTSWFPTLTEAEIINIIREVKETLAAGFKVPLKKTFTTADLWNIQGKRKNHLQRRFHF